MLNVAFVSHRTTAQTRADIETMTDGLKGRDGAAAPGCPS
jgi:hypothetical protein